jgi:thermostable 8-oxoguanine DNA glycosylase
MKRLIFFILILVSCNKRYNCEIDTEFKKRFDENINFLVSTETEGDLIYQTTDKIKVIYFLESVTGIKSQIYWGDVFGYRDSKSLEEDLKKWKNWYKNNKCEMTIVKADSLVKNYKKNK